MTGSPAYSRNFVHSLYMKLYAAKSYYWNMISESIGKSCTEYSTGINMELGRFNLSKLITERGKGECPPLDIIFCQLCFMDIVARFFWVSWLGSPLDIVHILCMKLWLGITTSFSGFWSCWIIAWLDNHKNFINNHLWSENALDPLYNLKINSNIVPNLKKKNRTN